jgi:NAD dependent epimerase/dehydratase family enzyme
MGQEMLLGGQRAVPFKLQAAGFQFQDTEIAPALKAVLRGEEKYE